MFPVFLAIQVMARSLSPPQSDDHFPAHPFQDFSSLEGGNLRIHGILLLS